MLKATSWRLVVVSRRAPRIFEVGTRCSERSASRAGRFNPREFHLHWPQNAVAICSSYCREWNPFVQHVANLLAELWRYAETKATTTVILIYLLISYAWNVSSKYSDCKSFTRSSLLIILGHIQWDTELSIWRNELREERGRAIIGPAFRFCL